MNVEIELRELGDELARRHEPSAIDADELLARILAAPPHRGRSSSGSAWPSGLLRPRRVTIAVAAVAAAAIALVVLLPSGGSGPFTPADASATLRELSVLARAREASELPLKQGQYFYRRSQGYGSTGESWTTKKGTGAYASSNYEGGRMQPIRGGDPAPIYVGNEELSYDEMLGLPATRASCSRSRSERPSTIPS